MGGEVTFDNSPFSLALFSFAPLGRVSPSCQRLSLSFSIGIRSDAPLPLRLSNPSSSSQLGECGSLKSLEKVIDSIFG